MAKKNRKKISGGGMGNTIFLITFLICAILFYQTSLVFIIGMLPTFVAAFIDRSGKGTLAITVGSMNLAGCTPFLLRLWTEGHSLALAKSMIFDPRTIIVMYSAAGIGYLINWSVSNAVHALTVKRMRHRIGEISKIQTELITRWGREVTGELPHAGSYGIAPDVSAPADDKSKNAGAAVPEKGASSSASHKA